MSSIAILLSIVGTVLIGAMSPGPSFVLVSHTAIIRSRKAGLAAALGMGIGGAIFALLALAGLHALLVRVEWAYLLFKLFGGAYLAYLGVRIWRGASLPLPPEQAGGADRDSAAWKSFAVGLATQLSNPKTALVYGSIFAAFLPAAPERWLFTALPLGVFVVEAGWYALVALVFSAERPRAAYGSIFAAFLPAAPERWLFTALPLGVFVVEAGWYALVALVFSAERPRAAYGRAKHVVDRIAGAVLVGLGVRLILDAVRMRPV